MIYVYTIYIYIYIYIDILPINRKTGYYVIFSILIPLLGPSGVDSLGLTDFKVRSQRCPVDHPLATLDKMGQEADLKTVEPNFTGGPQALWGIQEG